MRLTNRAHFLLASLLLIGGAVGFKSKQAQPNKWHKKASKKAERPGVSCYKCLSEEECQQGGELIQCEATFGCETRFPSPLKEYVLYRGCPTTPPRNATCFDDPMTGEHVCHCDYDACNAKGINLREFPAPVRVFKPNSVTTAVLPTAGQAPVFCYTCAGADSCKRGGIKTLCDDHNGCAIVYPDSRMEYVTAKTCSNKVDIQAGCTNERTPAGNYVCFCNTSGCNKNVLPRLQTRKQKAQQALAGILPGGFLQHRTYERDHPRMRADFEDQEESSESNVGGWEWVPGKWVKNTDHGQARSTTKRMRRRRKKFRTTTSTPPTTEPDYDEDVEEATYGTVQPEEGSNEVPRAEKIPQRQDSGKEDTFSDQNATDTIGLPPSKMNARATATEKQNESPPNSTDASNDNTTAVMATVAPLLPTTMTESPTAVNANAVTSLKSDLPMMGNQTAALLATTGMPAAGHANATAVAAPIAGAATGAMAMAVPALAPAPGPASDKTNEPATPVPAGTGVTAPSVDNDAMTTRRTPYPTKAVTPARGRPKKPQQGRDRAGQKRL